jgi:hypothetical protein
LKSYCFAKLTILSASCALEVGLFTTCKYKLWNVLWPGIDGMLNSSLLRYSQFTNVWNMDMGRDTIVIKATRYGLESPAIKSRWGRFFLRLSKPALWPTHPPLQWVPGLFPGGKTAGVCRWPPNPI